MTVTDFTVKPDHPSGDWVVGLPGGDSFGEIKVFAKPLLSTPILKFPRTGWKYQAVCPDVLPGFEAKAYDDSAWPVGDLAIGHQDAPGNYPPGITTEITPPTGCPFAPKYDLLLRKQVPAMARFDLQGNVDDNFTMWVNGIQVTAEPVTKSAHTWTMTYSGSALDHSNPNIIAVRVHNIATDQSVFDILATSSYETGPICFDAPGAYLFTAPVTNQYTWTIKGSRDYYNHATLGGKGAEIVVKEFLHAGDQRVVIVGGVGAPLGHGMPGAGQTFTGTSTSTWSGGGFSMVSDVIVSVSTGPTRTIDDIATECFPGAIAIGGGAGGKADINAQCGHGGYPSGTAGGGAGGGGGSQTAGGAGGVGGQYTGSPGGVGQQWHGGDSNASFSPGGPGGGGYWGGGCGGSGSPAGSGGGGSSYYNPAKCELVSAETVGTNGNEGSVCVGWGSPPNQIEFNYTGAIQTWVMPTGILGKQIRIIASGGSGYVGQSSSGTTPKRDPGRGLTVQADEVYIGEPGTTLNIQVGGGASGRFGGWPDGGTAGTTSGGFDGGGGGGSTIVRVGVDPPIIIAGGGGGHAAYYDPAGGGDAGLDIAGTGWSLDNFPTGGGGATATTPGLGVGGGEAGDTDATGYGGDSPDGVSRTGGAGGAGRHGGGAGGSGYGGGGGSSLIGVGIASVLGYNTGDGKVTIFWRNES